MTSAASKATARQSYDAGCTQSLRLQAFLHADEDDLRPVVLPAGEAARFLDRGELDRDDLLELVVRDAVAVENEPLGGYVILGMPTGEALAYRLLAHGHGPWT